MCNSLRCQEKFVSVLRQEALGFIRPNDTSMSSNIGYTDLYIFTCASRHFLDDSQNRQVQN